MSECGSILPYLRLLEIRQAGYSVAYHEFPGPQTVSESIAQDALNWFITPPNSATVAPMF